MTELFCAGTNEYCITLAERKGIAIVYENGNPWIVTKAGKNTHYATPYGWQWFERI